jgi:hypothetical protein
MGWPGPLAIRGEAKPARSLALLSKVQAEPMRLVQTWPYALLNRPERKEKVTDSSIGHPVIYLLRDRDPDQAGHVRCIAGE